MKKYLLLLPLILFAFVIKAQQKNVIKINTLAPFGLVYERGLNEKMSLSLQYNGFKGNISSSSAGDYDFRVKGWSLDFKYFPLSNGKEAPEGFYFGPYLKWYPMKIKGTITEQINGVNAKGEADITSRIFGGGGVAGYQMISDGGFTLDVSAGGGFYALNLNDITFQFNDGSKKSYDIPNVLKFFNKTLAPRLTFSLGYAF